MITREEGRDRCLLGWNIRCNLCGDYGAKWIHNERPGWGSLALCPTHEAEFCAEKYRHEAEMKRLRTVVFEQERHAGGQGNG